jgi:glycosyltransferase involved in cell wall biosynthesis
MLRMEGSLARSAALIVSPLAGVGTYMAKHHGIPPERVVWVSNGVHYQNYAALPAPPETGLKMQYFGSIGRANDVASIIDALELANRSLEAPAHLQIIGSGGDRSGIMGRVAGNPALSSVVTFPDPVPSHQVPEAMRWGNALVLVVRDLPELYRYGISMNKLFDYLASGRWILMASRVTDNPISAAPGITLCDPSAGPLSRAIIQTSAAVGLARRLAGVA